MKEKQAFVVLHLWKWYVGCFGFSIFSSKKVIPCAWTFSLVSKISLCSNGNISIAHHYFWFRLSSCPPTPKMASTPFFLGYSSQPLLRTLSPQRTEAEEEEATIDCNSINQKRLLLQCIVLKSTLEKSFGCSF